MKPHTDDDVFEWISLGRDQLDPVGANNPSWAGNTVRHLMPDIFEAYAKIFHRLELNIKNIENPLTPEEMGILKMPVCAPLRDLVHRVRMNGDNARIKWRDIARVLGVPFVAGLSDDWFRSRLEPGCWPRYILGPADGYLDIQECMELAALLPERGDSRPCFFRLPEIPFLTTSQHLLYVGPVGDISAFPLEGTFNTPEYWWSAARDWCVCSDYDLTFTIVGGSRGCISRILSSKVWESIEVLPDLRIDFYAPAPPADVTVS